LNETTVTKSQSNNEVGLGDVVCANIDQGEDEGGKSEGSETKRSRVGESSLSSDIRMTTGVEIT